MAPYPVAIANIDRCSSVGQASLGGRVLESALLTSVTRQSSLDRRLVFDAGFIRNLERDHFGSLSLDLLIAGSTHQNRYSLTERLRYSHRSHVG
jgi:hypothetical protein